MSQDDDLQTFPTPLEAFQNAKRAMKESDLELRRVKSFDYSQSCQYHPKFQLESLFNSYDSHHMGSLSESEFQLLLNNEFPEEYKPFNFSVIRLLFTLCGDTRLTLHDFYKVWHFLNQWISIFELADIDSSRQIDYKEYVQSLKKIFGEKDFNKYFLSNLNIITMNFKTFCDEKRELGFDRFLESVIWLIKVVTQFRMKIQVGDEEDDDEEEEIAVFNLQEFLEAANALKY